MPKLAMTRRRVGLTLLAASLGFVATTGASAAAPGQPAVSKSKESAEGYFMAYSAEAPEIAIIGCGEDFVIPGTWKRGNGAGSWSNASPVTVKMKDTRGRVIYNARPHAEDDTADWRPVAWLEVPNC